MPVGVGGALTLADVVAVARGATVEFPADARARVEAARAVVERVIASGDTIYGVTTGFGSLADVRIDPSQAAALQLGIVRSHATAVGRPLSREEARAMLLLRAHVLALGYSGVRPLIVDRMVEMLNRELIPSVPEQGSLGASGDLAPLANLALPLIGQGELLSEDGSEPAGAALAVAGLSPIALEAKEGLALVNGTQGMLAVGILAARRVADLARAADVTAAMSVEAALGTDAAFDERLQRLRPHAGQVASASNLRRLLAGSSILSSHRESPHLVQDAYSLRCAPQVHGATRDALNYVEGVLQTEAGAVSDNPIVLPDDDEVRSGGNFHGQPVAVALDTLAIATVGLGEHQRTPPLPAARSETEQRPARVPDRGQRAELRLHARAVHRRVARLGVQVARAPGLRRFDPVVGGSGGSREHGHDRRPPRTRHRDERRARRGDGSDGGRAGARSAFAAGARGRHARRP